MTENPWTKLSSRDIYENPWIKIREDQVLNPSGKNGIYGVVSFKSKAIGVIPIDENGFTWLVGQYRYPLDEYSWEIPEGGGPLHENPLEAAKRELKEETGYVAGKWTFLARMHTSNSVTDEEALIFVAEDLIAGESEPEETEQLVVRKVHLSQAVEMVMNNEITDSMSVYGLLKIARQLGI